MAMDIDGFDAITRVEINSYEISMQFHHSQTFTIKCCQLADLSQHGNIRDLVTMRDDQLIAIIELK